MSQEFQLNEKIAMEGFPQDATRVLEDKFPCQNTWKLDLNLLMQNVPPQDFIRIRKS